MNRDFIFVWEKNGDYKVFNLYHANTYEPYLNANCWRLVSTIDPSLWIEALIQHEPKDALDMIRELRGEKAQ